MDFSERCDIHKGYKFEARQDSVTQKKVFRRQNFRLNTGVIRTVVLVQASPWIPDSP